MLIDQIKKANIEAMKAHDADSRAAFSLVISSYQTLAAAGKGAPTDADVVRIIQKFSKELDEEVKGYFEAGRQQSYEATLRQKQAIAAFLPKMLSEEEIKAIIAGLEDKSIPAVMKYFKANYDGQCDMGLVSKIARS